jgi:hypothetical protein
MVVAITTRKINECHHVLMNRQHVTTDFRKPVHSRLSCLKLPQYTQKRGKGVVIALITSFDPNRRKNQ